MRSPFGFTHPIFSTKISLKLNNAIIILDEVLSLAYILHFNLLESPPQNTLSLRHFILPFYLSYLDYQGRNMINHLLDNKSFVKWLVLAYPPSIA